MSRVSGSRRLETGRARGTIRRLTGRDLAPCGKSGENEVEEPMSAVSDFRSDTITRPTEAMRRAMATAEVGDDVFGDDPTVNRLEALAAETTGKEAALFVPSGTMGNQIALKAATCPGDEGIVEASSHMILFEVGAAAMISGVQLRTLRGRGGVFDLEELEGLVRDREDIHQPRTRFLAIENTHNMAGGTVVPIGHLRDLRAFADRHGLHLHMDGARLFNAAVASGIPAARIAECADTVMFCLSKSLAAPIGSILASDRDTIRHCRKIRKWLGGGMRQAGVVAAAALVALETMVERLAEDHRRARRLAEEVAGLPGIDVDLESVQTNMVYLRVRGGDAGARSLTGRLGERGVLAIPLPGGVVRFVTHNDLGDEDIDRAVASLRGVLGA
jgi:threonine aldolase